MATEEALDIGEMDLECLGTVGIYAKKYFALRKKCEQIQQSNEKLVNRLYHVKRMIKKYRKEKKFLMGKLEEHGDNFREAEVAPLWEEPPSAAGSSAPTSTMATVPPEVADDVVLPKVEAAANHVLTAADGAAADVSTNVSPGGSSKGKKSARSGEKPERDAHAPKKPANAFLKFCQQRRPLIQEEYRKEENEEIGHKELTHRLAGQWNSLPPEKKNVYYQLYEQEKEKYEQDMEAYTGAREVLSSKAALEETATGGTSTPAIKSEGL